MRQKTALIVGCTGQDGAYLSAHLLKLGYRVVGTSRDAQTSDLSRLLRLRILSDINLISLAPNDFRSVLKVFSSFRPDEIYNLAGQTSVGLSFEQPLECMESIATSTLNMLEVLRYLEIPTRFFNAGSSESFGEYASVPANESTPFHPISPYAIAKSTSYWQVATYRQSYGIYACTGILGNHESPLRPDRFVTQKIVKGVQAIADGTTNKLDIGNFKICRDWGWAPDYVKAMHMMLQANEPNDFVIASGVTTSLETFTQKIFDIAGLPMDKHIQLQPDLIRPSDIGHSALDPSLIKARLGWKASYSVDDIVLKMYYGELY